MNQAPEPVKEKDSLKGAQDGMRSFSSKLLQPKAYREAGMQLFLGIVVLVAVTLVIIGVEYFPGLFSKPRKPEEKMGMLFALTIGYAAGLFLIIRSLIRIKSGRR